MEGFIVAIQTLKNESSKEKEVDNRLEKYILLTL